MPVSKKKQTLLDNMQAEMGKAVVPIIEDSKAEIVQHTAKKLQNVPWYPPNEMIKRELRQLAFDENTTMSKLLTEGIDRVFKSRGKPSIKELGEI